MPRHHNQTRDTPGRPLALADGLGERKFLLVADPVAGRHREPAGRGALTSAWRRA